MSTTGVVNNISEKQSSFGTMYNVQVDNQWYGFGKYPPKFKKGDTITFEAVQKGNFKNIDPKTAEVVAATRQANPTAQAAVGAGNKDDYWKEKEQRDVATQRSIQLQASRNSAIALVVPLAAAGLITLPAKDKFTAIKALVSELTDEFYLHTKAAQDGEYKPEVVPDAVPFSLSKDEIE